MPIDLKKELIFVHVPKTGGTTIEEIFGLRTESKLYSVKPNEKYGCTPQHFSLQEIAEFVEPDFFQIAHKFAFVRNPWDRLVSEYHYLKNLLPRRGIKFRSFSEFPSKVFSDFNEFVGFFLKYKDQKKLARYEFFDRHLTPQHVLMDGCYDVFKFEKFDEAVRTLCAMYEVANRPIRLNFTEHEPYASYYNQKSIDLVSEFYREDIMRFGYDFIS